MNQKYQFLFFAIVVIGLLQQCTPKRVAEPVIQYLTSPDKSNLLTQSELVTTQPATDTIIIDTTHQFQAMAGFGYTLTGGSAMLLQTKLTTEHRTRLLNELFLRSDSSLGLSYLRISIGASDLDSLVFSYADLPTGKADPDLKSFSLAYDTLYLIPTLKEIMAINPQVKLMGSPWSAPVWMKTNQAAKGGSLQPKYYALYANYLVKYLEAMKQQGIQLDAITIQNEPENPHNTPSMLMTASEQNEFIRDHLGPLFKAKGIETKIVVFDHNADHPEYPIAILNDSVTRKYVAGTAFHLYLGEVGALLKVHAAHPDKALYFTEQWTSGNGDFGGDLRWHLRHLIIGAPRNYSTTVLEWNLAADPAYGPHTPDGGCTLCLGALTIGDSVTRNVSYFIIGHASRAVPPGSVRILSTDRPDLPTIAYLTPENKKVLIVLNDGNSTQTVAIKSPSRTFNITLKAGEAGTYIWK